MLSASWHGLLANLAVVALFVSVWTHTQDLMLRAPKGWRVALQGLLMGVGAIATMMLPYQPYPGVYADLRTTLVAVAGLFGGPIPGLIAGAMAAAMRLVFGGAGIWAGIVSVTLATMLGIGAGYLLRARTIRSADVFGLALLLAACSAAGMATLPAAAWAVITPVMMAPTLVLTAVSFVVAGLAVLQDERRRESARSNLIHRAIIEALPDCLNAKDVDGRFVAANPATARLMDAGDDACLIGKTDFDFYPAETAMRFRADETAVMQDGKPLTLEQEVFHADGRRGWLSTLKAPLRDEKGRLIGLITHNRDITDRKALEVDLSESRKRLSDALAHMADGLVMFDREGRIILSNQQYRAFFPKTADLRVPGASLRSILAGALASGEEIVPEGMDAADWIDGVAASLGAPGNREIRLQDGRWLDARTRPTEDGGCLIVFSDITHAKAAEEALAEMNRHLEALARTDGLTGLMNRRAFDSTLNREIDWATRHGTSLSLLLIDVDRFKNFNDRHGHLAGDECLRNVSRCLQSSLKRVTDLAARYGGEELAVILPGTDSIGALAVAERFRDQLRAVDVLPAHAEKISVTVSIGVATIAGETPPIEPADFIGRADEALYSAKRNGRDRVEAWSETVETVAGRKVSA